MSMDRYRDRTSRGSECRVYVGNLPPDIRTKDIEDLFYRFGKISRIDLKNKRGPPFAFIEFEDHRKAEMAIYAQVAYYCPSFSLPGGKGDAEDAVMKRDGYDYDGYKLRVEFPKGGGRSSEGYDRRGGGRGFGRGDARGGRQQTTRRSQFRVLISGLPVSGSWQDLKDHMREAGDVCYADAYKDGTGVVEFLRQEDMKYAIKKLDDSKFRSHEGETAYISVREDTTVSRGSGRRTNSRSRSSSPGGGGYKRTSSPKRSYSRSRSRSRSYERR